MRTWRAGARVAASLTATIRTTCQDRGSIHSRLIRGAYIVFDVFRDVRRSTASGQTSIGVIGGCLRSTTFGTLVTISLLPLLPVVLNITSTAADFFRIRLLNYLDKKLWPLTTPNLYHFYHPPFQIVF